MEIKVNKVWIDDKFIYIKTSDGGVFSEAFDDYSSLRNATAEQRAAFEYNDFGIRWDALDEDLSFAGFMHKNQEEKPELYHVFKRNPELNVSAIARSMGIPQSLMASYICGYKKPSPERMKLIENRLHSIGDELLSVSL
jgi:hypothetical protein